MQKQQDSSDSAYQPHLRLTETNSGFGVHGSVAESYRGSDPSEVRTVKKLIILIVVINSQGRVTLIIGHFHINCTVIVLAFDFC